MTIDQSETPPGPETAENRERDESPQGSRSRSGQKSRGNRPPEGGDERRRRKAPGGDRRPSQGFGDGIERAYCLGHRHLIPPSFPVQHRTGLATMATVIVARRPGEVLLCDLQHEGDHSWPDGTPIEGD